MLSFENIKQTKEHLKLISLVKKHPAIYDTSCSEYRDYYLRHSAWQEVSKQYGKSEDATKEEWIKLRNSYNNALRRRQGKNLPPWRLAKQMSFLKPCIKEDTIKVEELHGEPEIVFAENRPITPQPYKRRRGSISQSEAQASQEARLNSELDDMDHFFISMSRMVKKLPKSNQIQIKMDLHQAICEVENLKTEEVIKSEVE